MQTHLKGKGQYILLTPAGFFSLLPSTEVNCIGNQWVILTQKRTLKSRLYMQTTSFPPEQWYKED